MIDAALKYIRNGMPVIPISPENKRPYVLSWDEYRKKLPTEDQIRAWWRNWPEAMIGLVCGELSGLCLVDVDTREAGRWLRKNVPSIGLPHVKTPRPGWHYYFKCPPGLKCHTGFPHENIDIRAEGGLAYLPPSKRANGEYSFIRSVGFRFQDVKPFPEDLKKMLPEFGAKRNELEAIPRHSARFEEGYRDSSIFSLAHHLIKGGMDYESVTKYVFHFADTCNPPFSKEEAIEKMESAIKRNENKGYSFQKELVDWVSSTDGHIRLQDAYTALHCVSREDKSKLRTYIDRLVNNGVLFKTGRGDFRVRKENIQWLKIEDADLTPYPIKFPFGMHDMVHIPEGSIVLVGGQQGAGKTAYLLNVVMQNVGSGREIVFLSTETREQGLKIRLSAFSEMGMPLTSFTKQAKFAYLEGDPVEAIENYKLENALLVLDYLEVSDQFWLVGSQLSEIFKKMKNGVAVVGLQMNNDRLLGGRFGFHKPEVVLTLKKDKETRYTELKIEKARWWADSLDNPEQKSTLFSLIRGCYMKQQADWAIRKEKTNE